MAADGPNHRGYILGSAATARCRTATSCALSGAHSSTRPVHGELGSAPRPAASEHERSPMLVTLRSEENVYVLSQPLAQHQCYAMCLRPKLHPYLWPSHALAVHVRVCVCLDSLVRRGLRFPSTPTNALCRRAVVEPIIRRAVRIAPSVGHFNSNADARREIRGE